MTRIVRKGMNKDINGDGFPDLVAGSPFADLGKGRAFSHTWFNYLPASITSVQDSSAAGVYGQNNGHYLGYTVSSGDVNGDGYADLIVNARGAGSASGHVYIFHSTPVQPPCCDETMAATVLVGPPYGALGRVVADGNMNGDGYDDVIGALEDDNNSVLNANGAVYIFHSAGASGIPSGSYLSASVALAGTKGNHFGYRISLGDVNGDSQMDLAISEANNAGAVYLFYGVLGTGIAAGTDLTAERCSPELQQINNLVQGLSSPILSGNNFMDLAAGSLFDASAGTIHIFQSSGAAGIASGNSNTAVHIINGNQYFGSTLAAGDLNGNGYADLISMGGVTGGSVYVFQSSGSSGITNASSAAADSIISGSFASGNSNFGFRLAVSDVNSDGFSDLFASDQASNGAGRVFFYRSGGTSGIPSMAAGAANRVINGSGGNSQFGYSIR